MAVEAGGSYSGAMERPPAPVTPQQPAAEGPSAAAQRVRLPDAPLLLPGLNSAVWVDRDGSIEALPRDLAARKAQQEPPLLCHRPLTAARLGLQNLAAFDLLELYAFVRPASFCVPTAGGIATALGLAAPADREAAAVSLRQSASRLLSELAAGQEGPEALGIAWTMAEAGWPWGPSVLAALGFAEGGRAPRRGQGFNVWERLPDWHDEGPPPKAGSQAVDSEAARQRLAELLDWEAEARPQQADYAGTAAQAFAPSDDPGAPNLVLAEAGTGIGKTLGYIAPASLWSEINQAPVWISTYTRNLQHQIDGELDRLYPEHQTKRERTVIRKGRENYLCLLNLQEAAQGLGGSPAGAVALGLMARWAGATNGGDMVGGDFPGWLVGLLGRNHTLGLTDRRGECIYSACQHYGKCFIERSQRRAKRASFVVANHALVMLRAALEGGEDGQLPSHYVFDEGHHLFEAADNAFAAHLSGQETRDLRRWLLGSEGGRRSAGRSRGLRRRIEDLLPEESPAREALDQIDLLARQLPGDAWRQRLNEGRPQGSCEAFLAALRTQVLARDGQAGGPYSQEVETRPVSNDVLAAAETLDQDLQALLRPLESLRRELTEKLSEDAEDLESEQRRRIDAARRGLERRGILQLRAWRDMLANLREEETPGDFCDWFGLERLEGRELDVGMYRHWVDPTRPFAETLLAQAQGVLVTSATLTDGVNDLTDDSAEADAAWQAAEARCGAQRLGKPAERARFPSPFDYKANTRVLVVNDVARDSLTQVAGAYRALFLAAGGGALGLFTAINRLRAVHGEIASSLEESGLTLLAQHLDAMDTATLVDIFRAEEDACLLGTDAVRDGVDVPGSALRLIVFDRVPWPRPDLRHKARRAAFDGRGYDDRLTRLKLKQAYGRLIRRGDDRGIFVILDSRMPSRLLTAFPPEVETRRLGLAEAVALTRDFFQHDGLQNDTST